MDIPSGLGSVDDLIKRFSVASSLWEQWRSLHQDAFDYSMPQTETFTDKAPGQHKGRRVYDSTAVDGVGRFASRLQAALTPPWMEWAEFVAGSEIPEKEREKINESMEKLGEIFFSYMNHSDFSNQDNSANRDLSVGTGGLMFEEGDPLQNEPLFKFTAIPLAQLYLEPSTGARVETFWRKHSIEARQLKQLWPEGDFGTELEKTIADKPNEKVEILDGVLKNGLSYDQVVLHEKYKQVIFTQSYETNPGIIFRWEVSPNETYGRGPIITKLDDIKTLNKVVEFELKQAALALSPPMTAVDDGVFNPYTARVHPGTTMPVSSNASTNPTLAVLDVGGNFAISKEMKQELRLSINTSLFVNPLGDITDPVRSATENLIRQQEMLKDSGASFGRLMTEKLRAIIVRGMEILAKNGKAPAIRVDGKEVDINFLSPIAKANDMEDFSNSQVWYSMVQQLPPEVGMLGANLAALPRYWGEKLGIPAELSSTEDEIKEAGQQIAQAAEQQLQQQQGMPPEGAPQ